VELIPQGFPFQSVPNRRVDPIPVHPIHVIIHVLLLLAIGVQRASPPRTEFPQSSRVVEIVVGTGCLEARDVDRSREGAKDVGETDFDASFEREDALQWGDFNVLTNASKFGCHL